MRFFLVSAALALCTSATAAPGDITLERALGLPNSVYVADVWGYADTLNQREYAIVGENTGKIYIIDVTDPATASVVSELTGVPGFDVKVWDHYIYACDGFDAGVKDSRVIDIADPTNPVVVPEGFSSSHNIAVSPAGFLVLESPGFRILDLTADPLHPTLIFEKKDGDGHDATVRGDLLYDFHGVAGTFVYDVTDPSAPVAVDSIQSLDIVYHHSGDITADGQHVIICDELATGIIPDITIWDVSTAGSPVRVASISDPTSSVHNLYVVGDYAFVSYYSAGFKVFDLSEPSNPVLVDAFDTSRRTGEGFVGAFGVYPFTPSGRIYVSDIDNGLFVFSFSPGAAARAAAEDDGVQLSQNAPNPFNPATTISYTLARAADVHLAIFDVAGRRVLTLVDGERGAGTHNVIWEGRDAVGRAVPSGVYYYRLVAEGRAHKRSMVLLK